MKEELLIFCRNVAWIKQRYRLTNRQMAEILGVGEGSVRKVLSGEIPERLSAQVIIRLAKRFSYRPSEWFLPLYEKE
ncbi:MAG: hypothetical protein IJO59_07415 [Clostridia bacterium]|nr:hypothetical protein [Clostridia bacterium]